MATVAEEANMVCLFVCSLVHLFVSNNVGLITSDVSGEIPFTGNGETTSIGKEDWSEFRGSVSPASPGYSFVFPFQLSGPYPIIFSAFTKQYTPYKG